MSQSRLKRSERFEQTLVDRAGASAGCRTSTTPYFVARSLEVVCPLDRLDEWVTDVPLPPVLGDVLWAAGVTVAGVTVAGVTVHGARAPAPRQRFVNRDSRTAPAAAIC